MIDSENLRTASLYINNQLLSRGLLRDGQNIDFADPGRAGLDATMGKVMSVVNDLILRRDRDAEARESLAATLRTLRASEQRQAAETARQAESLSRARQQLDAAEASSRSLRERLAAAERSAARLREEEQRARALAAQARAACARDLRRRDKTIEDLKKAVVDAGRVRGQARGTMSCVTSISVVGEVAGRNGVGSSSSSVGVGGGLPLGATEDEGYDLSLETNEFLTRLASGLSEENEGLRALVRRTVEGLREMSGLESGAVSSVAAAGALNGSSSNNNPDIAATNTTDAAGPDEDPNAVIAVGTATTMKTAEELSADLDAVLDHLRTILTNPSFVPIEEVEVRDEEIRRLRAGFGRLEARWRDAVVLIDGWRRRMGGGQKGGGGGGFGDELSNAALMLSPVRIRDEVRQVDSEMDVEREGEGGEEAIGGVAVRSRLSCVREEDEEEEEEEERQEEYAHVQERNFVSMSRSRIREQRAQQQQQQRQGRQEQKPIQEEEIQKCRSPSPAESLHLVPAPGYAPVEEEGEGEDDEVEVEGSDSSIFEDDIDMEALEAEEPNVQVLHESTWQQRSADSSPLPEPPQLSPLKDSYASGNKGLSSHTTLHRLGPGDFTTIVEENTWDLAADAAVGGVADTAAAEDPNEEEPPVPPPHTVDYKQRQHQGTPNTKENRPKASELLFSEESTMYDSPLFGRSGEKPSMSDPTRKLFSKPPSSRSITKEPPPAAKQQEPEQPQQPERRRTRQSERPKSSPADSPSAVTTRSQTRSAKRKSNPCPSPSADQQQQQQQQPSRPSTAVQATSTTSRSTASQDSTTKSNATSTTTVANTASTSGTEDSATTSQHPPPASPSRNDNNGKSGNGNGTSTSNAANSQQQQQQQASGSRLPRRNNPAPVQQSPLTMETIAAKLAAAEREADAARVRAKLRAARLGRRVGGGGADKRSSGSDVRAKGPSEPTVAAAAVQAPPPQQQGQDQKEREQVQQQQAELAKRQERQPAAVNQHHRHDQLEDVDPVKKSLPPGSSAVTATGAGAVPSPRRYPGNSSSNSRRRSRHNDDDEADELATSGGPHSSGGPSEIVIPKRKRDRKTSAVAAAASRRASRRRSTLSPWELESLIQGNVGSVESPAR
ncbi:hypothetical protein SLS62_004023 [Diatrype stigma]|uniref:Afadin and alpha-actinin-binding-domain-containing protein n=1 Tax=Diatrype stigma TaxID=117547 RepID=A0AAN9UXA0_9PEZI